MMEELYLLHSLTHRPSVVPTRLALFSRIENNMTNALCVFSTCPLITFAYSRSSPLFNVSR